MSGERRCGSCGAPLAEDQRYCLNCGRRHGDPRIDFRQYEAHPAQQPREHEPTPAPAEEKPARDYTPLAAVGGIAVLGVMLLIGVLIGKGDSGGSAAAPPPVIVGGGAGTEETAATGEAGGGMKNGAKEATPKGGKKETGVVKGGSANTGNAAVASDDQLQELQEQSPQEYAENSAKLPDEIATGGAPPPEDDKAPGGGSKGTAIE